MINDVAYPLARHRRNSRVRKIAAAEPRIPRRAVNRRESSIGYESVSAKRSINRIDSTTRLA